MGLRIDTLLDRKRMGVELTNEELRFFVHSLMNKRLTQAQVGAFCAFTTWRGMTQENGCTYDGYGTVRSNDSMECST